MKSNQFISDEDLASGSRVWEVTELNDLGQPVMGAHLVTFDKDRVFNLFADYPHNFSTEQVAIIKEEMPFWAEFFSARENK